MGDDENAHLRHLEERLSQLTQLLIDAGERLTEERARSDAQRLTLLRLIELLAADGTLDAEGLRAALSLAEIRHQADARDPNGATMAYEIRQIRSELERSLTPAQAPIPRSRVEGLLHAARQTLPAVVATIGRLVRARLPTETGAGAGSSGMSRARGGKGILKQENGADGGDQPRADKPIGDVLP